LREISVSDASVISISQLRQLFIKLRQLPPMKRKPPVAEGLFHTTYSFMHAIPSRRLWLDCYIFGSLWWPF